MRSVFRYVARTEGAIAVEWVAVTIGLLTGAVLVVHALTDGGVNPVREELNSDFNRVKIQP